MKKAISTVHPDEVYTEREAAELLGVSPRTVRRRIDGGELAATWRGNRWHIPGWSLIEYRDGSTSLGALRRAFRAVGVSRDDIYTTPGSGVSGPGALWVGGTDDAVKELDELSGLSGIGFDRLTGSGGEGYAYMISFPASWVEAVVS